MRITRGKLALTFSFVGAFWLLGGGAGIIILASSPVIMGVIAPSSFYSFQIYEGIIGTLEIVLGLVIVFIAIISHSKPYNTLAYSLILFAISIVSLYLMSTIYYTGGGIDFGVAFTASAGFLSLPKEPVMSFLGYGEPTQ